MEPPLKWRSGSHNTPGNSSSTTNDVSSIRDRRRAVSAVPERCCRVQPEPAAREEKATMEGEETSSVTRLGTPASGDMAAIAAPCVQAPAVAATMTLPEFSLETSAVVSAVALTVRQCSSPELKPKGASDLKRICRCVCENDGLIRRSI